MKRITALIACLFLTAAFACTGGGGGTSSGGTPHEVGTDKQTGFLRTVAEDDYGGTLTPATEYTKTKYVGLFYFLWLSQAASNANTINSFANPEVTITGDTINYAPTFTWWGEPMYGFYQVEDRWVVRKHVELFINAGLDFICFDTTNNDYYLNAAEAVLDTLLEYYNLGYNVPKAMFMTNSDSVGRVNQIYDNIYNRRDHKYDPIWFRGKGQDPWIIGNYDSSSKSFRGDVQSYFYFKAAQWPNATIRSDTFPWISWRWPQETYKDVPQNLTIMSVSVAQHVGLTRSVNFSLSGLCAPYNDYDSYSDFFKNKISKSQAQTYYNANWGRGYTHKAGSNDPDKVNANVNFNEQWETVYNNTDVNLVFVTGWNEWVAQKQTDEPILGNTYGHFVDTFNTEFSRDIEMMNGGYLDNCFIQLVENVRRYKRTGADSVREVEVAKGIDLFDVSSWGDVTAYADLVGETEPRNFPGAGGNIYTNNTGRNDIEEVRVAVQGDDVYFLVTAAADITERQAGDSNWMNVFVGIEGAENGWNGYGYVLNRSGTATAASLDRVGANSFENVGTAEMKLDGRHMIIKVSKSALGISGNSFSMRFKVCDNLQKDFDITELYTNGDCAPIGRISYSFNI